MRGRKPKYSPETIAELAARVAAGESPSALAKEKLMSRSSVRRCAASARLPVDSKSENLEAATQVGTARQRERLFWNVVEAYLRQAITLAPDSTPKDVATMFESVVKLRALMPVSRSVARLPERQKAQETLLIFQRSLSPGDVDVAKVIEVAPTHKGDLSEGNRTALETASDGDARPTQGPSEEANDATR